MKVTTSGDWPWWQLRVPASQISLSEGGVGIGAVDLLDEPS